MLDRRRQKQLENLLARLGVENTKAVKFELLDLALTHSSISPDANYEQLEFVGDAVLRLAASEVLFESYPDAMVGEFAAIRSVLVSDRTLAEFAELYGFERFLLMSSNVGNNHGGRVSVLADAFEAVLGALYLSVSNMSLVRPWFDEHLQKKAVEIRNDPARYNYKDALQEWSQGEYKLLPVYKVQENPRSRDEGDRFVAEVFLRNKFLGRGTGRSKKMAEQAAAKEAFNKVQTPANTKP